MSLSTSIGTVVKSQACDYYVIHDIIVSTTDYGQQAALCLAPIIRIAKFMFEGLLRTWNPYPYMIKTTTMRWDKIFRKNGLFLVLELLKPNGLRQKRNKKLAKSTQ